jgi:hypothetical protein
MPSDLCERLPFSKTVVMTVSITVLVTVENNPKTKSTRSQNLLSYPGSHLADC